MTYGILELTLKATLFVNSLPCEHTPRGLERELRAFVQRYPLLRRGRNLQGKKVFRAAALPRCAEPVASAPNDAFHHDFDPPRRGA